MVPGNVPTNVPPDSSDDRWKERKTATDRSYSMASLRNSGIGAAVFGVVLVLGIIRMHRFVVERANPTEIPGMVWVTLIFPALAFLLAFVNLRAYRRALTDPNYDLSKMTPGELQSPEELKDWLAQQQGGGKKQDE